LHVELSDTLTLSDIENKVRESCIGRIYWRVNQVSMVKHVVGPAPSRQRNFPHDKFDMTVVLWFMSRIDYEMGKMLFRC